MTAMSDWRRGRRRSVILTVLAAIALVGGSAACGSSSPPAGPPNVAARPATPRAEAPATTAPATRAPGRAAASGAPAAAPTAVQTVAIVVNPHATISNLSFVTLRRVFMGEQQFWPDHSKVTLLVRAPTARERSVVLDRIYQMSEEQFRQYWIGKMFRAEVAGGPKLVYSTDMALTLASTIKGSITFVPASAVTRDVKVLRIDGKLPGDAGYVLR